MDSSIHVGAHVSDAHTEHVAKSIVQIFEAAHKSHMDQETVREAIKAFASTLKVEHVTIQNCTLFGERTINIDPQAQE